MLAPGTVVDARYEIVAPLGAGGMGQVYRARRPLLGDEVALKMMHTTVDAPLDLRQRFLRESRACAQLRHPHIVTILDFNVDQTGQPYLVMELLNGPSLRDELEVHGRMSPEAVVDILSPVATALQLAHDRGITHRDLKPANIVAHRFESGERVYKVIDFGLASMHEQTETTRLTTPDMFLGTLPYAAPEQLRGEAVDHRTDIYTLGVIVYEMLTGRRPFDGEKGVTLINQTLSEEPLAPGMRCSGLSEEVDGVVLRALAKEPAERWGSVAAFARAFQDAVGIEQAPRGASSHDTLLSRYQLGAIIGRGRFGSLVYHGTHLALGVAVAIRVLRREEQPNWDAVRDRFLIEARTLQVPHPNLLQVRDYGEDDRLVYLVTDFIDGPSLREELARAGRMPWRRTRNLLGQMLDAAATLNARGGYIVGVNPDMIRLSDGGAAVHAVDDDGADAHPLHLVMSTAGISSVQDVLATMREQELRGEEANEQELPYVAPEVLMGHGPDAPADVFTAGVLAYQMVSGNLPFRARNLPELLGQMLQGQAADPCQANPEISAAASAAIVRALSPDPALRFASVSAFATALGV